MINRSLYDLKNIIKLSGKICFSKMYLFQYIQNIGGKMENTCNDLKMVTETISYKIPKNYIISEKKGKIDKILGKK